MDGFNLALMLCLLSFVVGTLFGFYIAVEMAHDKSKAYLIKWVDYDFKKMYVKEIEE